MFPAGPRLARGPASTEPAARATQFIPIEG